MSRETHVQFCESLRVRFPGATHLVVGFENRMEAERFLKAFRERLAKFGLELHPEKTRRIEFGRFAAQDREKRGEGKPETFTFLGFTHHCGKRRSKGRSSSGGKRRRNAWWRSCTHSKQNCASECTSRLPTSVHGYARL